MKFSAWTLAPLLALPLAQATITPTSPDGSTTVKVGDTIEALWTADSTDGWTDVEIQLMTGDNLAMVSLATVATGIDGTSATSFSFVAPDVSQYSKIYFLQFTNGGNMTGATWTTRFTIAGADGSTTEPTNSTDFHGQTVEWGTGQLLSSVSASSSNSSSSSSEANSTSASAVAAAVTASASSSSSSSSASSESPSASSGSSESAAASNPTTHSASSANASSGSSTSSGSRVQVGLVSVFIASALGLAALV
ncbi:hypothetical protein I314_06412 [Cryptococcus bacillisporus CA1873]|uniref:Yeast cell wall synthesis Kre9/Knh1-like N-terminal domain-containing protein n=1 Tax=Cryptococcus bacillisporus CA1873 TaxID=1296111 RepID=A0ABR5B396_CRYGA|nr:hypothetical protein I314_06412 [Cryptococcus bacillisporus CA1873]|eukprot:KIR57695.1 hypothetical protein I314_06412 [Cryptococcus gattii CA1873]